MSRAASGIGGRPDGVAAGAGAGAGPCEGARVRDATEADLPALGRLLGPHEVVLPADDDREWLLVSQDAAGSVRACLRVRRAIGLDTPRYWYHVGRVVHAAEALGLFHQQRTLLLGNDHTGASELTDLACDTRAGDVAAQASVLAHLLQAALLLIARERERDRFAPTLVAELPGLRDAAGVSPFWQGLGAHFYAGDVLAAEARFGPAWRSHVAALLPRQPLVASFLSQAAQDAIARAAPIARVPMQVLADEGLRWSRHVRIDDGGPVFEGHLDLLPAVLEARRFDVGAPAAPGAPLQRWRVAAGGGRLVCVVRASADEGVLRLAPGDEAALPASGSGCVWALPCRETARRDQP